MRGSRRVRSRVITVSICHPLIGSRCFTGSFPVILELIVPIRTVRFRAYRVLLYCEFENRIALIEDLRIVQREKLAVERTGFVIARGE